MALIAFLSLIAIPVVFEKAPRDYKKLAGFVASGLFVIFAGALFTLILSMKKKIFYPHFLSFSLAFFILFSALPVISKMDATKVPYALQTASRPLLAEGKKLGVYPSFIPSVNYYLDLPTPVFKEGEEEKAISYIEEGNLLLIKKENDNELFFMSCKTVWEGQISDDSYLLVAQN